MGNRYFKRRSAQVDPRVRWWKFQGESWQIFMDKIIARCNDFECTKMDKNPTWAMLEHNIKEAAKEVLGEFKGYKLSVRTHSGGIMK
ncbi:hypothetical protein OROHE_027091 [Orobanche hederae]